MASLFIVVSLSLLYIAEARTLGDRQHTISKLNLIKILNTATPSAPATEAPTQAGFTVTNPPPTNGPTGPTTAGPTCSTSAYTQTGTFENMGATFVATFTQNSASETALQWVDLHVSKNCQLASTAQLGQCATSWYQEPFDQDYSLNLHASSDASAYSSFGASYSARQFTFTVDLANVGLSANDVFCYAFTYDYPNFACNSAICTVGSPTVSPTAATVAPSTPAGFSLPSTGAASVCSILQYTQSATYNNGNFVASFTPERYQPVYVDLHVSKNCPGAGPSTGQCPTPFVQVPYYDEDYAYNFHDAVDGSDTDSSVATFSNGTFFFNFQNTKITLAGGDYLCYSFTYSFDNRLQCDIGSCTP